MNKNTAVLFVVVALLLPAQSGASVQGSRALKGEYVWNSSDRDKLEAVFTSTGDGRWDVAFHFRFSRQPRVFRGTAEGEIGEGGDLQGTVRNESERRTFVFRGSFTNGKFRGVHAEVRRGRESKTGTLTLRSEIDDSPPAGSAP